MTNDQTIHSFNHTLTRTDNLNHAKTGTETKVIDNDETRTDNLNSEKESEIQGFNSEEYQPANRENIANTGTQSNAVDETDTLTYNTNDADTGSQTHAETGSNTDTRNYLLNRSGNIGVTTTQDMIQSERELWEYNFRAIVYRDIDSIMTIEYYKGDCES